MEENKRELDIVSYGMLIDHCAKHSHVGSALMLLKECTSIHNAPPNEHSLNLLRRHCRQREITEKMGLVELAGPDPLEWMRHGKANLKRDESIKGRQNVLLPSNIIVHI